MHQRIFLFAITILFLIFACTQEAPACSCLPPPPPDQAFADAHAVFMGKVVSFEFVENGHRRLAKISLIKIWKGDRDEAAEITTPANSAACGYDFQVGEIYLIYAYKYMNDGLQTHICTRTAPARSAVADLKYLDSISFLPLNIGNTWTFTRTIQDKILDTIRVENQLYSRFDHFRDVNNAWLRTTDEGKLMMRIDTTEQMWLDFGARIGDQWPVRHPNGLAQWTVRLLSKTDTVKVPAGEFVQCFRFRFQFNGADNDWEEWYAPNVGPVRRIYYGIAVFDYPLASMVLNGKTLPTSVSEKERGKSIRTFDLGQSYPNPFTPANGKGAGRSTTMRYRLSEAATVALSIYNLLGREIKTLVQRREAAGEHEAIWDGTDAFGNKAPAGIYFYRLQVGKLVEVRKLILAE